MDFAVPPVEEELGEASASEPRARAHCGAGSGILCAADQGENRGGGSGSDSGAQPRAHRGTVCPKKFRRLKRQKDVARSYNKVVDQLYISIAKGTRWGFDKPIGWRRGFFLGVASLLSKIADGALMTLWGSNPAFLSDESATTFYERGGEHMRK